MNEAGKRVPTSSRWPTPFPHNSGRFGLGYQHLPGPQKRKNVVEIRLGSAAAQRHRRWGSFCFPSYKPLVGRFGR